MPISAIIILGAVLLIFTVLDIIMLTSLLKPGDERSQIIVWKASSVTLLGTVGTKIIDVIESIVRGQPMVANPLVQLEATAIVYFVALVYYKRRHGG